MCHWFQVLQAEVYKLQQQVDGPLCLLAVGRHVMKQGQVNLLQADTGKALPRYLMLVSDQF